MVSIDAIRSRPVELCEDLANSNDFQVYLESMRPAFFHVIFPALLCIVEKLKNTAMKDVGHNVLSGLCPNAPYEYLTSKSRRQVLRE